MGTVKVKVTPLSLWGGEWLMSDDRSCQKWTNLSFVFLEQRRIQNGFPLNRLWVVSSLGNSSKIRTKVQKMPPAWRCVEMRSLPLHRISILHTRMCILPAPLLLMSKLETSLTVYQLELLCCNFTPDFSFPSRDQEVRILIFNSISSMMWF